MAERIARKMWSPQSRALLVLFILLSFLLRIRRLDDFGFWSDEGLTVLRSSYSIPDILGNQVIIQDGVTKDTHPPLYYLLIHLSRGLLGESDFAYRYPSLLAGVLLVPLLFQFGRRLRGRALGLITAFLTAINPLQVWYGNEARMYALFVLLAAASSYILWRLLSLTGHRRHTILRYLPLYVLFSGLAIYTHYTALILVGAQSLFWIWLLWRKGQKRLLLGMAIAGALLAIPLVPFTVPRLFTGAEANYFYVTPIVMLKDVIHAFSLGVTADSTLLATKLLNLGMLGLLFVGLFAAGRWLSRIYLFIYLMAVVFGLMAGSLIKPMYQGVRHIMVGSPAFLLLISWGLLWLGRRTLLARGRSSFLAFSALGALGVVIVLSGPIMALDNYYASARYVKNDFRGLIQYVETNAGESDAFLFNNAILLPLHQHYSKRPDVAAAASPVYPYLAANTAVQQLESLAKIYDRLWFVTDSPADDRDKEGLVRDWLDSNLSEVTARNFPGSTTEVKVIAYSTEAVHVNQMPSNAIPVSGKWEAMPDLSGIQLNFSQPAKLAALWFDLFWEGGDLPNADSVLRFSIKGPDDREWLVENQPLTGLQADSWPDSGLVRQSYHLLLPAAPPPGTYTLYVQPLSSTGAPLDGETQRLTTVELAASSSRPIAPAELSSPPALRFENGLTLQAMAFPAFQVRPGHNLPFTLFWQTNSTDFSPVEIHYQLDVIGPDGSTLRTQSKSPGVEWLEKWPADTLIQENASLYFPPDTEPGTYRLRWQVLDNDKPVPGRPSWRPWYRNWNSVGEILVEPWPLVTKLPEASNVVDATFGSAIQLYGYDLVGLSGNRMELFLYWRATAVPDENYFVFVHLVSGETDEIVSQTGFVPVEGLRPTKGWRENEVLSDIHFLELPADLPRSDYRLIVGLFNPDDNTRPPVVYQGELQQGNQLVLATLKLP